MSTKTQNQSDWLSQSPEEFRAQFERQISGDFSMPATKQEPKKKKRKPIRSFFGWLFLTLGVLTIPFITLIRSSLIFYEQYELTGWMALLSGAGVTILAFMIGLLLLFRKVKNKKALWGWTWKGASVMVIGFCLYGLLYISESNTKSDSVRSVYSSLHPIMRVTIATVTLADQDLIITDISRTPEDYRKMGLTPRQQSQHYEQEDGFVHAIDLRTIGQSETRNRLLKLTFDLLGFKTLRHVGTADHLHIALPLRK